MVSLPGPQPVQIEYEVTVKGKKGKNPPTAVVRISASSPKEAIRNIRSALLGGEYIAKPVDEPRRARLSLKND